VTDAIRWVIKAVKEGLQLALLAPPVAAAIFVAFLAVSNAFSPHPEEFSARSLFGVVLSALVGAYLLGGIPSFVGGLVLRPLSRRFKPFTTSCLIGGVVLAVYTLTFGAHLISDAKGLIWYLPYAVPAFLGSAIPAYHLARRMEGISLE
jgi:hypothetical protein